jgi:hypothetical protein
LRHSLLNNERNKLVSKSGVGGEAIKC